MTSGNSGTNRDRRQRENVKVQKQALYSIRIPSVREAVPESFLFGATSYFVLAWEHLCLKIPSVNKNSSHKTGEDENLGDGCVKEAGKEKIHFSPLHLLSLNVTAASAVSHMPTQTHTLGHVQ